MKQAEVLCERALEFLHFFLVLKSHSYFKKGARSCYSGVLLMNVVKEIRGAEMQFFPVSAGNFFTEENKKASTFYII